MRFWAEKWQKKKQGADKYHGIRDSRLVATLRLFQVTLYPEARKRHQSRDSYKSRSLRDDNKKGMEDQR
jgi:hypothetical protein